MVIHTFSNHPPLCKRLDGSGKDVKAAVICNINAQLSKVGAEVLVHGLDAFLLLSGVAVLFPLLQKEPVACSETEKGSTITETVNLKLHHLVYTTNYLCSYCVSGCVVI